MQMAYNLTDMMWLGRLGSDAVASVGAASFFSWLGTSVLLITRIGAEVGVSQQVGRKNVTGAMEYARHALVCAVSIALVFAAIVAWKAPFWLSFLQLKQAWVQADAVLYLRIVSIGFVFAFVNPTFQGIYNGAGHSSAPFWYLLWGLVTNMVLDPVLIFGLGPIPALGVAGAALATVVAQLLVTACFLYGAFVKHQAIGHFRWNTFRFRREYAGPIFRLGLPVAAESALFSVFAMVLARLITRWGDLPLAVQSVGAQIEAISWMTASGLATALSAFVGQNFGGKDWNRIRKGYAAALGVGIVLGILVTLVFLLGGKYVFGIFLHEPEALVLGVEYLKILAVSQVFMIVEILTRGAFNGIGRTVPPSIVGIVLTGLRIPLALWLLKPEWLGMYAIWWAITFSSVAKGLVISSWFAGVLHGKIPFVFNRRTKASSRSRL